VSVWPQNGHFIAQEPVGPTLAHATGRMGRIS